MIRGSGVLMLGVRDMLGGKNDLVIVMISIMRMIMIMILMIL